MWLLVFKSSGERGNRMKRILILITLAAILCAGSALAEEPILVGSSLPLTGALAGAGQVMIRAVEMAADECNAEGGLLGRQLKVIRGDTGDMMAESVIGVAERLAASKVNVVLTGYDSWTNANIKAYGKYNMPYLTGTAYDVISDAIEEGMPQTNNCFDYCWDQLTYPQVF